MRAFLFLISFCPLIFNSCTKETAEDPQNAQEQTLCFNGRTICLLDTLISPIQSQYIETYKRDSLGRIIEYYSSSLAGLNELNVEYFYSPGNMLAYRKSSINNSVDWIDARIENSSYYYQNNKLKRIVDTIIPSMPQWEERFETIFEHDSLGRIVDSKKFVLGGKLLEKRHYDYDSDNNVIYQAVFIVDSLGNNVLDQEYHYTFDDKFNPLKEWNLPSYPNESNTNNIIEVSWISYGSSSSGNYQINYTYNKFGYPISSEIPGFNSPRTYIYSCD